MRSAMIIGLTVVLLIIGMLVIKQMGGGNPDGVSQTQAQKYIKRAENAADKANARIKDIKEQVSKSE